MAKVDCMRTCILIDLEPSKSMCVCNTPLPLHPLALAKIYGGYGPDRHHNAAFEADIVLA